MITYHLDDPIRMTADVLHGLIHPLVHRLIYSQPTFSTGTEVIAAFESYAQQGLLQATTLFATLHLEDLSYTCPHPCLLVALEKFLRAHVEQGHIHGISIEPFRQLVQFSLENQFCIYEHRLYRQTTGGAVRSPLIKALLDIYLFDLYQDLFSMLMTRSELSGRFLDRVVLTWNGTQDELQILVNQMNARHTGQLILSIGVEINCFDAQISHHQGLLQTRVFHEPAFEPYALPYVFDTSYTQSHLLILRAALLRAILYSSNIHEFENERLFIDLSFIINDVPLTFVQQTTENLLREFNMLSTENYLDDTIFQALRQRVRCYHQQQAKKRLLQRERRRKQRQRTRS